MKDKHDLMAFIITTLLLGCSCVVAIFIFKQVLGYIGL